MTQVIKPSEEDMKAAGDVWDRQKFNSNPDSCVTGIAQAIATARLQERKKAAEIVENVDMKHCEFTLMTGSAHACKIALEIAAKAIIKQ